MTRKPSLEEDFSEVVRADLVFQLSFLNLNNLLWNDYLFTLKPWAKKFRSKLSLTFLINVRSYKKMFFTFRTTPSESFFFSRVLFTSMLCKFLRFSINTRFSLSLFHFSDTKSRENRRKSRGNFEGKTRPAKNYPNFLWMIPTVHIALTSKYVRRKEKRWRRACELIFPLSGA